MYILRPNIELRSSNKLKSKLETTLLTTIQNGPYHRDVSLWVSRLPINAESHNKSEIQTVYKQNTVMEK